MIFIDLSASWYDGGGADAIRRRCPLPPIILRNAGGSCGVDRSDEAETVMSAVRLAKSTTGLGREPARRKAGWGLYGTNRGQI